MSSLADLPEIVGFFSYSREDDEAFKGTLSALRDGIQRELAAQLGRSKRTFRLWQDQVAIARGKLWESEIKKAVDESVFFIPIVTPRAVNSKYCHIEFETFLARERALDRTDLIFPILYIAVPALADEAQWRNHPVLSVIAQRQYLDWRQFRHHNVQTAAVSEVIEHFCSEIVDALRQSWLSPEERRRQEEAQARQRAEEERRREEAEARRQAEDERQRREAVAKRRTEEEARQRAAEEERRKREAEMEQRRKEEAEAKRREEEERKRAEVQRRAEEGRKADDEAKAGRKAEEERKQRDRRLNSAVGKIIAQRQAEVERQRREAEAKRRAEEEERRKREADANAESASDLQYVHAGRAQIAGRSTAEVDRLSAWTVPRGQPELRTQLEHVTSEQPKTAAVRSTVPWPIIAGGAIISVVIAIAAAWQLGTPITPQAPPSITAQPAPSECNSDEGAALRQAVECMNRTPCDEGKCSEPFYACWPHGQYLSQLTAKRQQAYNACRQIR